MHGANGEHDAGEATASWLDAEETVLATLKGVGASLELTERRIVIVRDGSDFRPRSGVRSWQYASILDVSLSQPRRGQARIVIRTGHNPWDAVSMFFSSTLLADAERVVSEIRNRLPSGPPRG